MFGVCRLWLKLVVAIALVVGCNVVAPAIGASAEAAVMTSDMPCHDQHGKGDALPSLCGKACLAIPAAAPVIAIAPIMPPPLFTTPASIFTGQAASPDTPPPRSAEQA